MTLLGRAGVLIACLLAFSACSQEQAEGAVTPNPALWQVESPNGDIEGWLFGTIHALPDGTQWRTEALENAFESADILAVEVAEFENAHLVVQMARSPGLGRLRNRVSPDRVDTLRAMLNEGRIPEGRFVNTEDWAAALVLSQIGRDDDPGNGVDRALILEAENPFNGRATIPVVELESLYSQLSIFDGLPPGDQREFLHSAIDDYASEENESAELRVLWLTGDVEGLEEALNEAMEGQPGFRKAFLDDRNQAMAKKVSAMLVEEDKPFVAVGAAHMIGAIGLPSLLESRGYRITRLQ